MKKKDDVQVCAKCGGPYKQFADDEGYSTMHVDAAGAPLPFNGRCPKGTAAIADAARAVAASLGENTPTVGERIKRLRRGATIATLLRGREAAGKTRTRPFESKNDFDYGYVVIGTLCQVTRAAIEAADPLDEPRDFSIEEMVTMLNVFGAKGIPADGVALSGDAPSVILIRRPRGQRTRWILFENGYVYDGSLDRAAVTASEYVDGSGASEWLPVSILRVEVKVKKETTVAKPPPKKAAEPEKKPDMVDTPRRPGIRKKVAVKKAGARARAAAAHKKKRAERTPTRRITL
jgi:hypothetical protein